MYSISRHGTLQCERSVEYHLGGHSVAALHAVARQRRVLQHQADVGHYGCPRCVEPSQRPRVTQYFFAKISYRAWCLHVAFLDHAHR